MFAIVIKFFATNAMSEINNIFTQHPVPRYLIFHQHLPPFRERLIKTALALGIMPL